MKSQTGVTLISLLIGLLIAMLCIIALLSMYRTITKTGAESRIDSTHDTQLQSGLTSAQMFLQNAGFGLDGSNHLLTATINVESHENVKSLLWRYNNGTEMVCQGLADIPDTKKRRFVLLQSTVCNDLDNLATMTWKVQSTLATLDDYSTDQSNPKQITFNQSTSVCTPFGAGSVDENIQHPLITISAQTSTQKIAGLTTVQVPVCLINIAS